MKKKEIFGGMMLVGTLLVGVASFGMIQQLESNSRVVAESGSVQDEGVVLGEQSESASASAEIETETEKEAPPPDSDVVSIDDKVILRVFSDEVEVLIPGGNDWTLAHDGMELVAGARVRTSTEGRAEVVYPGGTTTRLDTDSEIVLETVEVDNANFVIGILNGRVWSRVMRIFGKVSYETRTADVVATVRGTEYEHDVRSGVDKVMVVESQVEVSCINKDDKRLVNELEEVEMNCDDQEVKAREVSEEEFVDEEIEIEREVEKDNSGKSESEREWEKMNRIREKVRAAKARRSEKEEEETESTVEEQRVEEEDKDESGILDWFKCITTFQEGEYNCKWRERWDGSGEYNPDGTKSDGGSGEE